MDPSQMQLRRKATFAPIAVRAVIKKTRFKMDSLKALAYRHYLKKKKKKILQDIHTLEEITALK